MIGQHGVVLLLVRQRVHRSLIMRAIVRVDHPTNHLARLVELRVRQLDKHHRGFPHTSNPVLACFEANHIERVAKRNEPGSNEAESTWFEASLYQRPHRVPTIQASVLDLNDSSIELRRGLPEVLPSRKNALAASDLGNIRRHSNTHGDHRLAAVVDPRVLVCALRMLTPARCTPRHSTKLHDTCIANRSRGVRDQLGIGWTGDDRRREQELA